MLGTHPMLVDNVLGNSVQSKVSEMGTIAEEKPSK